MAQDNPFLGILLMLGFCVLAPMGDAIAKYLGAAVSLGLLLLVRFGIQSLVLTPLCLRSPILSRLSRRDWGLIVLRTVLHIVGVGAMFTALRFLPLADALAIAFVMPFILLLLGHFVLGEEVGPHRLIACAVGFCGTLLVIQPNFAEVGAPALIPLLVAVTFALFMLVTRQLARTIDAVALQWVSGWIAVALLAPALVLGRDLPPLALELPDGRTALLLLALGLLGTLAHLMMTWSLRFAPSATLAPMQYLEIPIGTLVGWIVFSDLPNDLAAAGIAVTIGAGLYIILRERALSRAPRPPAPTAS